MSTTKVSPAVFVRAGQSEPFYEAKWRVPQPTGPAKQVKRRVGKAWVEPDGSGGWRKRRGRTPDGWLDERSAHVAAAEAVARFQEEDAERERQAARAARVTFRSVAKEWVTHLENVDGAKPSTLANHRSMLAEPDTKHRRGTGKTAGRMMKAFGDRPIVDVMPRDVADWLTQLDGELKSPRNVNRHRQVLHSIFEYATRPDTHGLPVNPVAATSRRREDPPGELDFYESSEVELLGRAIESGGWRKARGRARDDHEGPEKPAPLSRAQQQAQRDEQAARSAEDRRDADFFRLLFFSGLRLSEALALKWNDVQFLGDMSGAVLSVQRSVSAGEESSTKSRRTRQVPIPRAAAEALARVGSRGEYVEPDDYVFANRLGRRLDGSAMRRRYKGAREAAKLREVKLHGLRHAAGSVMARSMPLISVRDILGHAKLETTNRYLHSKIDAAAVAAVNAAFGTPLPDVSEQAKARN